MLIRDMYTKSGNHGKLNNTVFIEKQVPDFIGFAVDDCRGVMDWEQDGYRCFSRSDGSNGCNHDRL